jgi:hypothetical protein
MPCLAKHMETQLIILSCRNFYAYSGLHNARIYYILYTSIYLFIIYWIYYLFIYYILYTLVGTRVLRTLWNPPVSLNQERHTLRRKVAKFIFILYISVLEAWGAPAGPFRAAQAGLAWRLSGHFLGGVPQTQTSKDPPSNVDTRLATVPNLWTNSNNRLQPSSSTRLSRNPAAFIYFVSHISPPRKRNRRL